MMNGRIRHVQILDRRNANWNEIVRSNLTVTLNFWMRIVRSSHHFRQSLRCFTQLMMQFIAISQGTDHHQECDVVVRTNGEPQFCGRALVVHVNEKVHKGFPNFLQDSEHDVEKVLVQDFLKQCASFGSSQKQDQEEVPSRNGRSKCGRWFQDGKEGCRMGK